MKSSNFEKFAKSKNINSNTLNDYKKSLMKPKNMTPMVIETSQMNASTISVFDRLMMDRIIFLGEEIDDITANIINAQLLFLDSEEKEKDEEPIWLYINSPGGSVYDGLAIYDVMQAISSSVYTAVLGSACSMAAVLAMAGKKKHRYALKHSRIMIHQPWGGMHESQATDMDIANREMQELKLDLLKLITLHSGQTFEKVKQDCERDYWLKAQAAIDYGIIDKIMTKF